jgi:hypothetical protein
MNPEISLLSHSLARAASRVLMEGSFLFTLETDEDAELPAPFVAATVQVRTDDQPVLWVDFSVPEALAVEITQSHLGETGAVEAEDVRNTISELVNVIAGAFARLVVAPGNLCSIGSPMLRTQALPDGGAGVTLTTDDGQPLRVWLRAEGQ